MKEKSSSFLTFLQSSLILSLSTIGLFSDTIPPLPNIISSQPLAPFVTFELKGQLGNVLFESATACALAWSHNAEVNLPEIIPAVLRKHVFFRCSFKSPQSNAISYTWGEKAIAFAPIPYRPNMKISGYFQSEKFFKQYRDRLLALFAPGEEDTQYIEQKYQHILNHPNSVGVQLRYYKREDPLSQLYPQYGKEYLKKAMSCFSQESLFVISSNNLSFAKAALPSFAKNVVFLENEPNYIDLFVLSRCKDNIITNSSFGWWGAWLNQNPDKLVLYPEKLFYYPYQDYCPPTWKPISANPEK